MILVQKIFMAVAVPKGGGGLTGRVYGWGGGGGGGVMCQTPHALNIFCVMPKLVEIVFLNQSQTPCKRS